jgi:hypothetical protein
MLASYNKISVLVVWSTSAAEVKENTISSKYFL